jgi:hypothetical protein
MRARRSYSLSERPRCLAREPGDPSGNGVNGPARARLSSFFGPYPGDQQDGGFGPKRWEVDSGGIPYQSLASTFAALASSIRTISVLPVDAAQCKAALS